MTIALVVLLITVSILIPLGILITTKIKDAIPNITDTEANQSAEDVFSNTWTAFSLSALVPIVAAAGLIISIIVGAFAFRLRG